MTSHNCTVLAFANQKGGVGKTTSTVNLAASLGLLGKKVLLVDFDPQGNATSGVGIEKTEDNSAYDLIMGANPYNCIHKTEFENLDALPSEISLAGAELELVDVKDRQYKLKTALDTMPKTLDAEGEMHYCHDQLVPAMGKVRETIDHMETLVASSYWPVPTYCDLLFSV